MLRRRGAIEAAGGEVGRRLCQRRNSSRLAGGGLCIGVLADDLPIGIAAVHRLPDRFSRLRQRLRGSADLFNFLLQLGAERRLTLRRNPRQVLLPHVQFRTNRQNNRFPHRVFDHSGQSYPNIPDNLEYRQFTVDLDHFPGGIQTGSKSFSSLTNCAAARERISSDGPSPRLSPKREPAMVAASA